jgi:hypothetical protein
MYLILIMALNSQPLIFKETKIYCSDIVYTWERLYNTQVGIKTKTAEYVTQHADVDALDADIKKQCKK